MVYGSKITTTRKVDYDIVDDGVSDDGVSDDGVSEKWS